MAQLGTLLQSPVRTMASLEGLGRFSSNLTYIVGRIQFCFVFQAVGQGPFSTSLPCGTFHRAAYSMATGFPQSMPSNSQRWGARQMSQSFCNLILQVTALLSYSNNQKFCSHKVHPSLKGERITQGHEYQQERINRANLKGCLGSSLVVYWSGFGAFTGVDQVRSLVRELKSCKPKCS